MSKALLLTSLPVNYGAGGSLRDLKVVPHIAKYFRDHDVDVYWYPPYNTLYFIVGSLYSTEYCEERVFQLISESIRVLKADLVIYEDLVYNMLYNVLLDLKRRKNLWSLINRVLDFGWVSVKFALKKEEEEFRTWLKNLPSKINYGYSTGEGYFNVYLFSYLSRIGHPITSLAMLRLEPYSWSALRFSLNKRMSVAIANTSLHRSVKKIWEEAMKSSLKGILSVSPAPLVISRIHEDARRHGVKIGIPFPANAFDKEILGYRKRSRERVAVYFGRVTKAKGIFELLASWKLVVKQVPDARLLVIGPLSGIKLQDEAFIKELKNTPNVEYLGFLKNKELLFKVASRAKLLIYPSHQDAFPLTVLESLALGLAVVAYDIPALRYVYKSLRPVFLVREGDMVALATKAVEILKMNDEELDAMFNDEKTRRFLELHSSWENVAKADFQLIKTILAS